MGARGRRAHFFRACDAVSKLGKILVSCFFWLEKSHVWAELLVWLWLCIFHTDGCNWRKKIDKLWKFTAFFGFIIKKEIHLMFYFVCVLQDVDCGWRGNQLRQEKQCNCDPVKLVNKMELRLLYEKFFHVVPCVCSCFSFCSTQKHSVLRTVIKNSHLKSVAIPAAASRGCLEISDKKLFLTQMVSHCFLFISRLCWIVILGMCFFRGHRAPVTIWSWCADLSVTCQHDKHLQLRLSTLILRSDFFQMNFLSIFQNWMNFPDARSQG